MMILPADRLRRGFYRRPLFWWGWAAAGAVLLASEPGLPSWAWTALVVLGIVLAVTPARAVGGTLAVAGLFGWLGAAALAPPSDPALRDGAAVTLRGVVRQRLGRGEVRWVVLQAEERLTPDGWVAQTGCFAARAPGAALGDVAEVSGLLERPLPSTGPGNPDRRLDWLRRGVRYTIDLRPRGYRLLGREEPPPWRAWAERAREAILALNRRTLSPLAAGVVNDFLIGDAEPPEPELAAHVGDLFRASGTIHLLVVSGTQVSLVLGPFIWLGQRLRRGRFLFWGAGCAVLAAYFLLTDGAPPISRAGAMGVVCMLGLALERELDGENCLGAAALLLLLFQPLMLFDIGFQLSFLAVWALIRLAPPLYDALKPRSAPPEDPGPAQILGHVAHRMSAAALAACAAAHLGVAPLLALHFQSSTWSGILANVPMVFAAGRLLAFALAHLVFAACGATFLAGAVEAHVSELYGWASIFALPPFGTGSVFPTPLWLLPLCLLGVAAPALGGASRLRTLALAGLFGGALFLSERLPAPTPRFPTLRALDIGQGDALLLQGNDGSTVMVDAGPPRSRTPHALRALRVAALDAVLVSHPHSDHIGGLAEVLREFPVGLLIHSAGDSESAEWREALLLAKRRRVPMLEPQPGDRLQVRGSALTVLGPLPGTGSAEEDAENERSLVVRWDSGGARVLLTGDMEEDAERALLRWGPELRADVLKVSHHGSNGSTGPGLLRAVRPTCAVISCGRKNRYGHPGRETLARLDAAGIPVARTDLGGTITLEMGGGAVGVSPYLDPSLD